MKKAISLFLALVFCFSAIPITASAARASGYERFCTACKAAGDFDGNNAVEVKDALALLKSFLFPNRYPVITHSDHAEGFCGACISAGDLDQNGTFDISDVLYLLYHTIFLKDKAYALPGCTCIGAFFVGYARGDITPEGTMEIYGSTATKAHDPLQLTCTAVDDGENTALLFSLDLRSLNTSFTRSMMDIVEKEFNIPGEQMMFNITHTHSAPSTSDGTDPGKVWRQKMLSQVAVVVREALADLDEVEGVYTGTGLTSGVTFVRRYLMPDGTYKTNPGTGTATAHETTADNQMRTIRFDRKNKKDVLMVNYQTHYGSATGLYKGQYSADFVHEFRERVEAELDCHFVYHSGASGNLNFMSAMKGERKYPDFIQAVTGINTSTGNANGGKGLIPAMKDCLAGEKAVSLGKIRFASSLYAGEVLQDTEERKANAKIVNKSGYATDSAEYKALCDQYGFDGYREVQGIVTRSSLGKTVDVPFYAICFGDIGFVSAPYEMFDTNGVQVREGSPYETTFVCSYTNGGLGYVPSAYAFPHKGYEVYVSRFSENSGEEFAAEMVRLLKECKDQK